MYILDGNCSCLIQPIVVMLKTVLGIIYVAVPLGLIIMGMIDFTKAMAASDESVMKKAQGIFIKRAISAAIVFFVFTIVQLVFGYVNKNTEKKIEWLDCWENPGEITTDKSNCTQVITPPEGGSTPSTSDTSSTEGGEGEITPEDSQNGNVDEQDNDEIVDHEE